MFSFKRLMEFGIVLATMLIAPAAGAAPQAASLGPPFEQPFTSTGGKATIDACTAEENGHVVAAVTSLVPTQEGICEAGAYMEIENRKRGRTLTVGWHVTEAFGLDDVRPQEGLGDFMRPNGPSVCGVVITEWFTELGCQPLGRVENLDLEWTFELGDPGLVQIYLWAQVCICGEEAAVPQTARIDAQLQSVTVR